MHVTTAGLRDARIAGIGGASRIPWTAAPGARRLTHSIICRRTTTMAEAATLAALASRFIETESVPWIETAPGNKMKVIYHDPATDMLTILSKLEPGAGIPAHVHEDLEQTFVLEGSLVDQEGEGT